MKTTHMEEEEDSLTGLAIAHLCSVPASNSLCPLCSQRVPNSLYRILLVKVSISKMLRTCTIIIVPQNTNFILLFF